MCVTSDAAELLALSCVPRPPTVEVKVAGELDVASAPSLLRAVAPWSGSSDWTIRLDLTGVSFVDAGALSALLQLREGAAELELIPSPRVERVLALTRLDDVFTTSAGVDAGAGDVTGLSFVG